MSPCDKGKDYCNGQARTGPDKTIFRVVHIIIGV